jgi:hypothetical protein
MPGLVRTLLSALASSQLLIKKVLGQSSSDFSKFPTCAQQYLAAAEPPECDDGYNTATDDCLCSNTGYFLTNSAIAIGANCGCDVLTTSAYLLVSICEEYAGDISMTEDQIIATGWGGSPTCSTVSATSSTPFTTTSSSPSTTAISPASSSMGTSLPTPAAKTSSGGLDADGKVTLALSIPGALIAIAEIIGWFVTGSWKWFLCGANKKQQQYQTLYQPGVYDRGRY